MRVFKNLKQRHFLKAHNAMVLRWPHQWASESNGSGQSLLSTIKLPDQCYSPNTRVSAFVRKRGQAGWSKTGSPCLGKEGAGGQYGEVVTNIALFVTHGVQYHLELFGLILQHSSK